MSPLTGLGAGRETASSKGANKGWQTNPIPQLKFRWILNFGFRIFHRHFTPSIQRFTGRENTISSTPAMVGRMVMLR